MNYALPPAITAFILTAFDYKSRGLVYTGPGSCERVTPDGDRVTATLLPDQPGVFILIEMDAMNFNLREQRLRFLNDELALLTTAIPASAVRGTRDFERLASTINANKEARAEMVAERRDLRRQQAITQHHEIRLSFSKNERLLQSLLKVTVTPEERTGSRQSIDVTESPTLAMLLAMADSDGLTTHNLLHVSQEIFDMATEELEAEPFAGEVPEFPEGFETDADDVTFTGFVWITSRPEPSAEGALDSDGPDGEDDGEGAEHEGEMGKSPAHTAVEKSTVARRRERQAELLKMRMPELLKLAGMAVGAKKATAIDVILAKEFTSS